MADTYNDCNSEADEHSSDDGREQKQDAAEIGKQDNLDDDFRFLVQTTTTPQENLVMAAPSNEISSGRSLDGTSTINSSSLSLSGPSSSSRYNKRPRSNNAGAGKPKFAIDLPDAAEEVNTRMLEYTPETG